MSGIFAITAAANTAKLDQNHQSEVTFTVSNAENRPIRGRVHLLPEGKTDKSWLSVAGDTEQYFAVAGTQQFTVRIKVPPETPAGSYIFRLNMVGVENPDEDYAEGPAVSIAVPEPVKQQRPFPWWILIVIAAVILIGALLIFFSRRANQPEINDLDSIHPVGEAAQIGDLVVVINSAEVVNSLLAVGFAIENRGQSDVTINPVNNFEAKAPDGTTLQQVLLGCNSIRAGGTIAPGENLSGDICYRAGSGGPFTISFRSPQDGTLVVTWQIE